MRKIFILLKWVLQLRPSECATQFCKWAVRLRNMLDSKFDDQAGVYKGTQKSLSSTVQNIKQDCSYQSEALGVPTAI